MEQEWEPGHISFDTWSALESSSDGQSCDWLDHMTVKDNELMSRYSFNTKLFLLNPYLISFFNRFYMAVAPLSM